MNHILSHFAKKLAVLALIIGVAAPASSFAQDSMRATDLPLPRFVSIKGKSMVMRKGPGQRYPIAWVYHRRGMPVEIVQEFDNWRKIRDVDGDEGWVHHSLLSAARTAIVSGKQPVTLRSAPQDDARPIARFEPGVNVSIEKCKPEWCLVEFFNYDGWIARDVLWGIYDHEDLS